MRDLRTFPVDYFGFQSDICIILRLDEIINRNSQMCFLAV